MPHHVFISYAHLDNKPLLHSKEGWVSKFDEALTNLLSQKIGEEAHIWRDKRMQPDTLFDQDIFNNLLDSLTLVSVVTPRYIKSDYCLKELNKFCEEKAPVGTKSRVFKVVKTHIELEEMPKIFQEINGLNFYKIDEETKIPREFEPDFGEESGATFLLKVSDLAYYISQSLKAIEETEPTKKANPDETRLTTADSVSISNLPTVYLATTSNDFQKERDNICRDLQDRGYTVLPLPNDVVPPRTTAEFKNFVRENLQKCSLAVHLVGKNYGECPEDGQRSYIHLQAEVAAERDSDPNFSRIVWLPKDVNTSDARHRDFVQEIWDSTKNGVEVLEKPLEDVKTNIQDVLTRESKPSAQFGSDGIKPSVLVLYDKTDAKSAAAIEGYIKKRGFTVWSAAKYFSGAAADLIEAQNEFLRNCDAVLIYWNNSPWTQIMLGRVQKIFGDGRNVPFLGEGLYIEGGNATDLADETEVDLMNDRAKLDAFLSKVKTAFQSALKNRGEK